MENWKEDCETRRDLLYCIYCKTNKHNTVVCGQIHAICVRCGSRGHHRCRKDTRNEELEKMRCRFERFANLGALTSLRFQFPQWGFFPYPAQAYRSFSFETLHKVTHSYSELANIPLSDMVTTVLNDLFPHPEDLMRVYNCASLPTSMKHWCEPFCSNPEWMNPLFYSKPTGLGIQKVAMLWRSPLKMPFLLIPSFLVALFVGYWDMFKRIVRLVEIFFSLEVSSLLHKNFGEGYTKEGREYIP